MFCEDCGEDLSAIESVPPGVHPAPVERMVFSLVLTDTAEAILLKPEARNTLGRRDADRGLFPDVDLTPFNAMEKGVSAMHAVIDHDSESVQIMDMGSTNGTYINDRWLNPKQAYILHSGDEIRFGQLVARIRF
jgi:pSer/pThr/pTyr-binding forkhead associated (FHA) protein